MCGSRIDAARDCADCTVFEQPKILPQIPNIFFRRRCLPSGRKKRTHWGEKRRFWRIFSVFWHFSNSKAVFCFGKTPKDFSTNPKIFFLSQGLSYAIIMACLMLLKGCIAPIFVQIAKKQLLTLCKTANNPESKLCISRLEEVRFGCVNETKRKERGPALFSFFARFFQREFC